MAQWQWTDSTVCAVIGSLVQKTVWHRGVQSKPKTLYCVWDSRPRIKSRYVCILYTFWYAFACLVFINVIDHCIDWPCNVMPTHLKGPLVLNVKGIVYQNNKKMLSSFAHPNVVINVCDFLWSVETKLQCLKTDSPSHHSLSLRLVPYYKSEWWPSHLKCAVRYIFACVCAAQIIWIISVLIFV